MDGAPGQAAKCLAHAEASLLGAITVATDTLALERTPSSMP